MAAYLPGFADTGAACATYSFAARGLEFIARPRRDFRNLPLAQRKSAAAAVEYVAIRHVAECFGDVAADVDLSRMSDPRL